MRTVTALVIAGLVAGLTSLTACAVDGRYIQGDPDGALNDGGIDGAGGPLEIVLSTTALIVPESQTRTFTVQLSPAPAEAVLVTLETSDDLQLGVTPTALLFSTSDWATPQTVTLTGKSDVDVTDEDVTVTARSTAVATPATVAVTVDDDDGLALALTPTALDVGEGSTGTIRAHLTAQPTADVVVAAASSNTAAATVAPASLTFTTANWNLDQSVTVTGVQDANISADSATIDFTSVDLTAASVAVTVTDDDVLGIQTSTSSLGLTEGGNGTFTLQLTQQPAGNVSVTVMTSNPAAATAAPTTLTFTTGNWNLAQTVTVTAPADDDTAAGSASITLAATGLANRTVAINVADDDVQSITAAPAAVSMNEGANATVNVRLAFRPTSDVTVTVSSLATAVATAVPLTLTFTPSNYASNQPVTLTAVQDADAAPGATTLRLEAAALGLVRDVTVNVIDDEILLIETDVASVAVTEGGTTTFRARLSAQPGASVAVAIASNDPTAATAAPTPLTFNSSNWNVYQMVTVTGVQDVDLVGETVILTLSSAGLTNVTVTASTTDNDTQVIQVTMASVTVAEGGTTTVGVALGYMPGGNVTVTVMSGDTAKATATPASLSFTPTNYATAQNVTVGGVDDLNVATETTTVSLMAASIPTTTVNVTVTDNDTLGIQTSVPSVSLAEGGTATFGVRLNFQPSTAVTVNAASADGGAATAAPAMVPFTTTNWNTYQNVTVTGTQDIDLTAETVAINLTATGASPASVSATVSDNDVQAIVVTTNSVAVSEGAGTVVGVSLAFQPAGNVTVNVASLNTGVATVSAAALTFTPADYATPQNVTITGVAVAGNDFNSTSVNVTSSGLPTQSISVLVRDPDIIEFIVSPTFVCVFDFTTGTVRLKGNPLGPFNVTISSGANIDVTPVTYSFDPGNFGTAQTVSIEGVTVSTGNLMTASSPGVSNKTDTITVRSLSQTPCNL